MDATVQKTNGPSGAGAKWEHELRNVINTAAVASALLRRSLESGSTEGAVELAREVENACMRCGALLRDPAWRPS